MIDYEALALRSVRSAADAYDRFGTGLPEGELLVYEDGEWAWSTSRYALGRERSSEGVDISPRVIMRADPRLAGSSFGDLAKALVASLTTPSR
jgi:hypothetical protein